MSGPAGERIRTYNEDGRRRVPDHGGRRRCIALGSASVGAGFMEVGQRETVGDLGRCLAGLWVFERRGELGWAGGGPGVFQDGIEIRFTARCFWDLGPGAAFSAARPSSPPCDPESIFQVEWRTRDIAAGNVAAMAEREAVKVRTRSRPRRQS